MLLSVLGALAPHAAMAHDIGGDSPVPAEAGVKATAAIALVRVKSGSAVPAARLSGVLDTGSTPQDLHDHPLEHATLQLGGRLNADWSAAVGWGWHGTDPTHSEEAWLRWEGESQSLRLGRQTVDRGDVINGAGHFDRFVQAPLVVRAAFDGTWDEDGLQWRWMPHELGALQTLDVGLWRAGHFPASTLDHAPGFHLHPSWRWGQLGVDAFFARLSVDHRGQSLVAASGAHSHASPDCTTSLVQVSCFDGRALLYGASAKWTSETLPFDIQGAYLMRDERGALYTASGDSDYRGRTHGLWSDFIWRVAPRWQAAVRVERLIPRHVLSGTGAVLVASDTGLSTATPTSRATAMASWQALPSLTLLLEAGRTAAEGVPGQRHAAVRVIWRDSLSRP